MGKWSSSRSFRRAAAASRCGRHASSHASLAPVPRAPSPPRGLPLLLPRAGETVAVRAVHRLARAHALSGGRGHGQLPVAFRSRGIPVPGGPSISRLLQTTVSPPCWFNPSQPPKGGAINARALFSLRITVGTKNIGWHRKYG